MSNIINTLQKSDEDWIMLYDHFSTLQSIASFLESDKRIVHYLERLFYVANKPSYQNEHTLNLINLLTEMFPMVNNPI